ncbi:MAG: hypothetical protein QF895_02280 [SAR86 cluster bacterium]|nr:hypothetical protein [SAR86 cluster bacterium]
MHTSSVSHEPKFIFEGTNHRLFIGGRGFDFKELSVSSSEIADLDLGGFGDNLYDLLDFEEPRVIYVVSRAGSEDLILQGCRIKEILGNVCRISYTRYQAA